MTQHALTLILLSALLHPIRDLLLKGHRRPESAYLAVTGIWVVIAAAHAFLSGSGLAMPGTSWGLAVASAACLTAYYFGTMAALKSGDLSIYYPIIRSSPLLIVSLPELATSRSGSPLLSQAPSCRVASSTALVVIRVRFKQLACARVLIRPPI